MTGSSHSIITDEDCCPDCGRILTRGVVISDDGITYDICLGCGFKRKLGALSVEVQDEKDNE